MALQDFAEVMITIFFSEIETLHEQKNHYKDKYLFDLDFHNYHESVRTKIISFLQLANKSDSFICKDV